MQRKCNWEKPVMAHPPAPPNYNSKVSCYDTLSTCFLYLPKTQRTKVKVNAQAIVPASRRSKRSYQISSNIIHYEDLFYAVMIAIKSYLNISIRSQENLLFLTDALEVELRQQSVRAREPFWRRIIGSFVECIAIMIVVLTVRLGDITFGF